MTNCDHMVMLCDNNLARNWPWITDFTLALALGLVPDANGDIVQMINGGGTNTLGGLVPNGLNGTDFLELFFATTASVPGFSEAFPATFFVFQWMHRSETDLLGRHLSGIGGTQDRRPGGGEQGWGWDGLVFAFQQPFPNLTWRFDASLLWDLNGGYLFQPAVRYKPRGDWTVEGFVNVVDGEVGSIFQPFDFMDDVTVRLTYQF